MTKTKVQASRSSESHNNCADCFRALADTTRLKVLSALQKRPQTVKELQKHIEVSQPTISHHIKLLLDGGVIIGESHGRETTYMYKTDHACVGCGVFSHSIKI